MRKSAPSTKAAKAQSRYSAFEGQTRTCSECGETKAISNRTFALKNKGPNGLSETCRQCDGSRAGKRRKVPKAPKGFQADPRYDWDAFVLEVDEKVSLLTELTAAKVKRLEDIEQLKADLTSVTRLKSDPAGGGLMVSEELAFKSFVEVLKHTFPKWYDYGPVHNRIISALLSHERNVCILASRNCSKSTLTYIYTTWRLWRDSNLVILVVSKKDFLARRFLKAVRSFMETCPLLEELRPDLDQHDSAFQIEVKGAKNKLGMGASLTSRGVTSQITGLRADLLIADDIEGPQDDTAESIDALEEALDEFFHVGNPGCEIKVLGTPQSDFSLYGRLSRSDSWSVISAPVIETDVLDGKEHIHSLWPTRWPVEELEKKRKEIRLKKHWRLHWLLDLSDTADDERPLRLGDLPVLGMSSDNTQYPVQVIPGGSVLSDLPRGTAESSDDWKAVASMSPDFCPITMTVAAIDPSSGLAGRDAIGVSIVSVTASGYAVIRHVQGVRAKTTQVAIETVARIIHKYRATSLLIEEVEGSQFGTVLSQTLAQRGYPLRFDRVKSGGVRKGQRIIEAIAPSLASDRVVICQDVLEAEDAADFVNQYTGIRFDGRSLPHDDLIDSLSYALASIGPVLSSDQSELIASSRVSYENLSKMDYRRTLMTGEELETWCNVDENMQQLRLKRDHVARTIQEDALQGKHDPGLVAYLEKLDDELSRIDTGKVTSIKTSLRRYAEKEHSYRKDQDINEGHISLAA